MKREFEVLKKYLQQNLKLSEYESNCILDAVKLLFIKEVV